MSEREAILARVREALKVPASLPGAHNHDTPPIDSLRNFSKWLPLVGANIDDQFALFRANSSELRTDFRLLDSIDRAVSELAAISVSEGWKKIAFHRTEPTASVAASLNLPAIVTDGGYDVNELESCDAGISGCDALVAQTGTVVVTTRSVGGRALSILPPHHVVIARRDQMLPDLPSAFVYLKTKYANAYPSMISLITGPSRTGDIERILVLGAHGPRKLTILCF